jgi:hypothetical protein
MYLPPAGPPEVWRTLRSHDRQRASRKLSVHAAALSSPCAHHSPHYTSQAAQAPRRPFFFLRPEFAKKKNSTTRGWGLDAQSPPPPPPPSLRLSLPFPLLPSPLFPSPLFLVRASFANKKNSTARGCGLGA